MAKFLGPKQKDMNWNYMALDTIGSADGVRFEVGKTYHVTAQRVGDEIHCYVKEKVQPEKHTMYRRIISLSPLWELLGCV